MAPRCQSSAPWSSADVHVSVDALREADPVGDVIRTLAQVDEHRNLELTAGNDAHRRHLGRVDGTDPVVPERADLQTQCGELRTGHAETVVVEASEERQPQ